MFFHSLPNKGKKINYELERIWRKVVVVYCFVLFLRIFLKCLRQTRGTPAATAALQICEFEVGHFRIRITSANHSIVKLGLFSETG
jgi:hypothetical protein